MKCTKQNAKRCTRCEFEWNTLTNKSIAELCIAFIHAWHTQCRRQHAVSVGMKLLLNINATIKVLKPHLLHIFFFF